MYNLTFNKKIYKIYKKDIMENYMLNIKSIVLWNILNFLEKR